VDDCPQLNVPFEKLMCPTHWRRVPEALQQAVYGAWKRGAGAGSSEHTKACVDAIAAVNELVAWTRTHVG
jgi:hypothetical protein